MKLHQVGLPQQRAHVLLAHSVAIDGSINRSIFCEFVEADARLLPRGEQDVQ